ncbi:MAG TPA: class I SAM-dependent methyltransferase [Burkholderiaceae bacterium]|nr:class I SAM-dependent methyltransferase [Burkholderiaceae bacterium]
MDPQASLLRTSEAPAAGSAGARRPRGSRLLLGAAGAWCRFEALLAQQADVRRRAFFTRVLDSVQRVSGAAMGAALNVDEKSELTVMLYDDRPALKADGSDLFEIESALFAKRLPPPPSRILVGACGTGREAVALAAQGYSVDAFDPAPECVAESGRRLAGRGRVERLSYEQLSASVIDGAGGDGWRHIRFDAVVLGCGSLSHVLDEREQRRLMRALHALCPTGPVIASFLWLEAPSAGPPAGRAARLGNRIGRTIARLRGMSPCDSRRLSYRARRGFAYTFSQRELEDLALAVGRRVCWERYAARPSPYATFLPIAASA